MSCNALLGRVDANAPGNLAASPCPRFAAPRRATPRDAKPCRAVLVFPPGSAHKSLPTANSLASRCNATPRLALPCLVMPCLFLPRRVDANAPGRGLVRILNRAALALSSRATRCRALPCRAMIVFACNSYSPNPAKNVSMAEAPCWSVRCGQRKRDACSERANAQIDRATGSNSA